MILTHPHAARSLARPPADAFSAMAAIASIPLDLPADAFWTGFVDLAVEWSRSIPVELRDAIVLVPFAQHLSHARRAWARKACWLPRIETTHTLARSLRAPELPTGSQLRFDIALDRLAARRLLRAQSWAAAWARQDARAFEEAVAACSCLWTIHWLPSVYPHGGIDWLAGCPQRFNRGRLRLYAGDSARTVMDSAGICPLVQSLDAPGRSHNLP